MLTEMPKPALKATSTVSLKYANLPPQLVPGEAPSTSPANTKKKGKGKGKQVATPPPVINPDTRARSRSPTAVVWADQAESKSRLTSTCEYQKEAWLKDSKPGVAHEPTLGTLSDHMPDTPPETNGSLPGWGSFQDEAAPGAKGGKGGGKAAAPLSAKSAKRHAQKEKAEALKRLQQQQREAKQANAQPTPSTTAVAPSADAQPSAPPSAPPEAVAPTPTRECRGCRATGQLTLECPQCVAAGIKGSFFCSQGCFKAAWAQHKRQYHAAVSSGDGNGAGKGKRKPSGGSNGLAGLVRPEGLKGKKDKRVEAAMAAVALLQSGRDETAAAQAAAAREAYLEAAARYESSIRLYRAVVDTGRASGSAEDGSEAAYVTGALQAEADAWKMLAYVRALLPESAASMPQALQAHMQALRRYMALGQRNKVVTVLVDTARTCLAVQDAARASTLLLKANTLVDQVTTTAETELEHASLLQYLGEVMTRAHLDSPQGWAAAVAGTEEDLWLAAAAARRLKTARTTLMSRAAKSLPAGTLGTVHFAYARACLLANDRPAAKEAMLAALQDAAWVAEKPKESTQAREMASKL